jgi:hypothetical protein
MNHGYRQVEQERPVNHQRKIGIAVAAGVLVLSGSVIGIASAVSGDGDDG